MHGGQHHLYYFPTVAITRHSSPPTDAILFPHAVSQLWPLCCISLPSKSLIKPLNQQIQSANLCDVKAEGVSLQQA